MKSQKINSQINEITQRIIDRSQPTRERYLQQIEHMQTLGRPRNTLGCGNLAHAMAASTPSEKKHLQDNQSLNIGIVSAYNDMLSAHQPYQNYPDLIKRVALNHGATAQVAGGVPAMCDGVTQGQPGMELSLFSREVIALSTAVALSHHMYDGVICLGICDKIVPGLLIGALRFGHLPTLFLPSGPMPTGQSNEEKAKVRQDYAMGKANAHDLLLSECRSYHSAGTCTFYGTANTNQMLMEIMGLHLPGASFITPDTSLREAVTVKGIEQLLNQMQHNPKVGLGHIISEKTLVNGLVGLMATGGSTNLTIHLIAMAKAAGIVINWQDMDEISKVVPLLCRIYPNGNADVNQFQQAGGMAFLINELLSNGLLHNDVQTLMGEGLEAYCYQPELKDNTRREIFRQNSTVESSQHQLTWPRRTTESLDKDVLRPVAEAFRTDGGLKLVKGNLGRAIVKVSAVDPSQQVIKAPAIVFRSQQDFVEQFNAGKLKRDFIAVLTHQGPQSNGMPELHQLTPMLSALQSQGFVVALVTDGRMSGASGKIPAAIHLSPEAQSGGAIAKIKSGDLIELDCLSGRLNVICEDDFENRPIDSTSPESNTQFHQYGWGTELFSGFRQQVSSAEEGATIFSLNNTSNHGNPS